MEDVVFDTSWEDVVCPICLDFPHNSVLLQCSSYGKGCRPFVCDTNQLHSNCLDRFKTACGMSSSCDAISPMSDATSPVSDATSVEVSDSQGKLSCPLCRGDVSGWIVVDKARVHFDDKKRCCDEHQCKFTGSYLELQKHAHLEHPHAHPSKIDPARKLDWENFQQSSEVIDVLSTIQSEIPRGVVLGDYVIEYGDGDTGDEFEDFPGDEGNWWTSCILYQAFSNFRSSRNRRRIRVGDASRGNRHSSYDTSNSDEGSIASVEYAEYRLDETDDDFVSTISPSRGSSGFRRDAVLASLTARLQAISELMDMESSVISMQAYVTFTLSSAFAIR
ncbi:putative transcription factor C2H2 family [Lupinus albus]|uniref:Putative transcription factor C2H2 family n=1 Tax=Lupinus albus TaxID=3870 RepID=A0A6A4Q6G4_LUPAL|nr:putative transcription factor C2H2 family [Lupinus albus]